MIADVTAKTPDGPRGNILLGNMLEFRRDPLTFLQSAAREYGPVVRGRFANQFFYMVSDPDAVQRILQDRYRQYVKGKFFEPVRLLIGNGLASIDMHYYIYNNLQCSIEKFTHNNKTYCNTNYKYLNSG